MKYPKYHSITHLSSSKTGEKDRYCETNQEFMATVKLPDRSYRVILQEKLDGANVAIQKIDGQIIATIKDGYTCDSAPSDWLHFHLFNQWVQSTKSIWMYNLADGQRICGEWLLQTHGIKYDLDAFNQVPFVAFDFFDKDRRLCYAEFLEKTAFMHSSMLSKALHVGAAIDVDTAQKLVFDNPKFKSEQKPEGFVLRVEQHNKVLYLVKWVRKDFVAGAYLPIMTNKKPQYNMNLEYFKNTFL